MSNSKYKTAIILMVLALVIPSLRQESLAGNAQGIEIAPTPLPTPTPGPDGNTYQSPYGWSISWSDEWIATTSNERTSVFEGWTDDTLYLTQEAYPDLTVEVRSRGGKQSYCQSAVFGIPAAISVDGSYLKHRGGEYHNWVVYMEEFPAETADAPNEVIATYYECRRIAEPVQNSSTATYVEFEATAPIDTYQATADSIQQVAGNLLPSPDNLIPEPTPTPTLPPTPTPLPPEIHTSPGTGWSIWWDPMDYSAFIRAGEQGSFISLESFHHDVAFSVSDFSFGLDSEFSRDVHGCLDQILALQEESDITDMAHMVDESRLPALGYPYAYRVSEDVYGWATFTMCVDMHNGEQFLLITGSTSIKNGGTITGMLEVVYSMLHVLIIP